VTFTAGEVKKSTAAALPLSLILGPGLVIGLYFLANLSYFSGLAA
jgi:hypothetical protein